MPRGVRIGIVISTFWVLGFGFGFRIYLGMNSVDQLTKYCNVYFQNNFDSCWKEFSDPENSEAWLVVGIYTAAPLILGWLIIPLILKFVRWGWR